MHFGHALYNRKYAIWKSKYNLHSFKKYVLFVVRAKRSVCRCPQRWVFLYNLLLSQWELVRLTALIYKTSARMINSKPCLCLFLPSVLYFMH